MVLKMKPIVYVDTLFILNLSVNYLLLFVTARFSKKSVGTLRLAAGAAAGALYAVFVFFPSLAILYTLFFKLLCSIIIIFISFGRMNIKEFIRVSAVFYLVSFTFGGAAFGLFYFTDVGGQILDVVNGGMIFNNISLKYLIISIIVSYIVIRISIKIFGGRVSKENLFVPAEIIFNNNKLKIIALIDTGNSLHDPISNIPVMIAQYDDIKNILPTELKAMIEEHDDNFIDKIDDYIGNSKFADRLRIVPFKSLGYVGGMLLGIRPDEVSFSQRGRTRHIKNIIIGIYHKKLSNDDSFSAIISPEIMGM